MTTPLTPLARQARRLRDRLLADQRRPVQAYASACSAAPGGSLEFRVSAPGGEACSVAVRRYGTEVPTPTVRFIGEEQDPPVYVDGLTWCDWAPSVVLDIPESWPAGLYVARFTAASPLTSVAAAVRGRSAFVPFVVRSPAALPTLVVLPFASYVAVNRWPVDGATGRSLEAGYTSSGQTSFTHRASAVSFDRPFSGDGLPSRFAEDARFAERLVSQGLQADFAASTDLHAGTVDPAAYDSVLFTPRDVYWSHDMRDAVLKASASGTGVRWPSGGGMPPATVGFEPAPDGRPDRVLARAAALPDHLFAAVPEQG